MLELAEDYRISVFPLAPAGQYGDRLVIDLYDKKSQPIATHDNSQGKRDIVIAIVAGHGGEDPGSIGAAGTYEKRVTLKIAQKLANLIDKKPGLKAVMIRSGDYYVDHNRKTELARKSKADLLISIHSRHPSQMVLPFWCKQRVVLIQSLLVGYKIEKKILSY